MHEQWRDDSRNLRVCRRHTHKQILESQAAEPDFWKRKGERRMIRNIEDEQKNIKRHQDSGFSGYLSDKELHELIGQVEEGEMLHAPAHLKENVLTQIRRKRQNAGKRQVFAYRAKVLIAMAAALAVLIFMPDDTDGSAGRMFIRQQESVSSEQRALERQRDIDVNWERYLRERESGGVRGFFRGLNEKITEFGTNLYDKIDID